MEKTIITKVISELNFDVDSIFFQKLVSNLLCCPTFPPDQMACAGSPAVAHLTVMSIVDTTTDTDKGTRINTNGGAPTLMAVAMTGVPRAVGVVPIAGIGTGIVVVPATVALVTARAVKAPVRRELTEIGSDR